VQFNFRFTPGVTVESLQQGVESILERHGLTYRLEWQLSGLPFKTPRGRLAGDVGAQATPDV
jgi:succinyl-diaminopimelate desuccinylase